MDIKWKDENGNIFNADDNSIRYLEDGEKTTVKKNEVKKVTFDEGLLCFFTDFSSLDPKLIVAVPKKRTRDGVKIFNNYDKTGEMLKKKSSNFILNLILDSSMIMGNPLGGIAVFIGIFSLLLIILTGVLKSAFGDTGLIIARIIVLVYPVYTIISYIFIFVKRKKLKEN